MRLRMLVTSAAVLLFAGATTATASPVGSTGAANSVAVVQAPVAPSLLAIQQQPASQPAQETHVTRTETTTSWWADPVWIGVGVIALLVIVLLIVFANRGSGDRTTVIR